MDLRERTQKTLAVILGLGALIFAILSATEIDMTNNYYDALACDIDDEIFLTVNVSLYSVNNSTDYYIGRPRILDRGFCYRFGHVDLVSITKPSMIQHQSIFIAFFLWQIVILLLALSYLIYVKVRKDRYEPI